MFRCICRIHNCLTIKELISIANITASNLRSSVCFIVSVRLLCDIKLHRNMSERIPMMHFSLKPIGHIWLSIKRNDQTSSFINKWVTPKRFHSNEYFLQQWKTKSFFALFNNLHFFHERIILFFSFFHIWSRSWRCKKQEYNQIHFAPVCNGFKAFRNV